MSLRCHSMVVAHIWILFFWTVEHIKACDDRQTLMNGQCCDKCSPGTYMKGFCSKEHQTICAPCNVGEYSENYHDFDRCERCQTCQQKYAKNCTLTTNAACACYSGFLCSNNICSHCVENPCVNGGKVNKTVVSLALDDVEEYTYSCVDLCPEGNVFDVETNLCKPRDKAQGLSEQQLRNKTHDNVSFHDETPGNNQESIHRTLVWGFVLLSLALLVFASCELFKRLRKHKAKNKPILAVTVNTDTFHLSKEESGLQFIIQDESKDDSSFCPLSVETLSAVP